MLDLALATLRAARPTAVNLMWALDRMKRQIAAGADAAALEREAQAIQDEDLAANRRMGELGASLIAPGSGVLTHCNTGSLATAGYGTALGVIRAGFSDGRIGEVFAGETRPWQQGARLTMYELVRDGIPAKLIADSAAAHLMRSGHVQWVIVGADRIAANGDTANKIGTYQLAIAARHHGVKFMVVAPSSTVDMSTGTGEEIEIEMRHAEELLSTAGQRTVVAGAEAWNPVFDVTPAELIDRHRDRAGRDRAAQQFGHAGDVRRVRLRRQIVLFGAGGALGLLVDAGVVQALVGVADWNPYLARLLSFLVAASVTWWWNRRYTFASHRSDRAAHAQWLHWIAVMSVGAMVNYGVYAIGLMLFPVLQQWPALPTAAGSALAALVNFSAARRSVFRGTDTGL